MALPDGLSKEEVEQRFADEPHLIWFWLGSMESLGILVHHREVPLPLVDDFFSGPDPTRAGPPGRARLAGLTGFGFSR